jgi:hypothetical protein
MSIFFTTFIRLVKVTWTLTSGQFLLFNLQYADYMDAEPSSAPTLPSRVPFCLSEWTQICRLPVSQAQGWRRISSKDPYQMATNKFQNL